MSYYFLYQKKGVPAWLAYVFILLLTIGLSLTFRNNSTRIISRASKNAVPNRVTLSNLTENSATISFVTENSLKSHLVISSENGVSLILFDLRDEDKQSPRKLHYFQINQLNAKTSYQYKIYLDGREYPQIFQFKTRVAATPVFSNAPVFGKVLLSNLQPADSALITLKIGNQAGSEHTTLAKATGEWIITLPMVYNDEGNQVKLDDERILYLTVTDNELKQSAISVKYRDAQPLRSIVVGQNYDFTLPNSILGVSQQNRARLITYPRNNATISSFYPVFRGTSEVNTFLKLVIKPSVANLLVTVDNRGEWKYSAQTPFAPGTYQILAKTDREQQEVVFHIGKSGESVLGEATPSATVILSPTVIATSTPTVITTPVPSLITPTITQSQIPRLGLNNNLLILFASGLSLLGLYLVLY